MTFYPQMVRWLADFSAEPLSKLFANSLTTAVIPTDWRLTIICPINKKGDPEDVSNYRPVSFTSIICKIFERIVKRALLSFLSDTRSISHINIVSYPSVLFLQSAGLRGSGDAHEGRGSHS